MKVLIGCEESQAVCIAFRERGFEAYSCDLQECSGGHPEWHLKMDVFKAIELIKPTLLIGHPPCTYISYAGIRWFNVERYGQKALDRMEKRDEAIRFFKRMWSADVPHICLENPRGFIQNEIEYTQMIHPYYFGNSTSKCTLLWLKNLPPLIHSKDNNLFESKTHVHKGAMCSSGSEELFGTHTFALSKEERSKLRSKTFPGIARAMAEQWGDYIRDKSFDNSRNKM